jgi:DNA polymerase-1
VTDVLLRAAGLSRGALVAVAYVPDVGLAVATGEEVITLDPADAVRAVEEAERALFPRWLWWSSETYAALGVRVSRCWDLAAVHRLLFGGWRADPALVWASLHDLPATSIPGLGQLDLLDTGGDDSGGDPEDPVQPGGHLRPEWTSGGWARSPQRLGAWASLALRAAGRQRARLGELAVGGDPVSTAHSESAAELLAVELAAGGLPMDVSRAEQLIASYIGARPASEPDAAEARRRRDDAVLRHGGTGAERTDLRNPAQVRALLASIGIEVADTRSWRLENFRGAHPFVDELLAWRKAERIATTYGYAWLDQNVGPDGRLRGEWSGSDGAAGRMTAGAGLHNLPAELRPAVAADPGHVFVRADLGQIEPRVLAAVSGDRAFVRATLDDDLYAPIAARLGIERGKAKVAVLAAMYGQVSGSAGEALRGLEAAYPVAMRYLHTARDAGRAGRDLRTYGGRLVRMWATPADADESARRSAAAARGRYARNAAIQGAAAELFKMWAVTVRARAVDTGAQIVLCLHDELLLHAPIGEAEKVAALVRDCLQEAAARWAPDAGVRFVADLRVVERWSDAKA